MDEADPQVESTPEVVGRVSYWFNEVEFTAAKRAVLIANGQSFDGWIIRLPLLILGHVLLLFGLLIVLLWLGTDFRGRPGSAGSAIMGLVLVLAGGWLLDRLLYGRGRRMRKRFRDSPLAGLRVDLTLTTDRLLSHTEKSDARTAWDLFTGAVELRDGFVLLYPPGLGIWLPKRGVLAPLDARTVAAFLRSKVANYRTIARSVRPRE
ncbi:YcxB family protein [Planctomyces sp. SH-PL62]|uniref:YcxB family protein n=1 Tax=Planctomyces sp. SH-PL62 TaxID=1636152 RepID=UPI00078B3EC5|nr:YcxB family protein [Planctomyces sp. SH-PL62]AMV35874.1 hypothetical protein VT85_00420 [Planctomyces sp. SH-PL62]